MFFYLSEIVALIELHKEMTDFSDWLKSMESDPLSSVDSEVLLTDSQLLLDIIDRKKVSIVCAKNFSKSFKKMTELKNFRARKKKFLSKMHPWRLYDRKYSNWLIKMQIHHFLGTFRAKRKNYLASLMNPRASIRRNWISSNKSIF